MSLISVYDPGFTFGYALERLYGLLSERGGTENISHRTLPTMEDHVKFVLSRPYAAWYLIIEGGSCFGAIYLTWKDEIGISVFNKYSGAAVEELMNLHPRKKYLVNINPSNERLIEMFSGMGFGHIQNTYEFNT